MLVPISLQVIESCSFFNYEIGKKLSISPIKILYNIGPNACYKECKEHGNCFSVNYNIKFFTCEFLPVAQWQKSGKVNEDKDFIYMEHHGILYTYNKTCGDDGKTCNYFSTCIRTLYSNVCIATDCAENEPVLQNGKIIERIYSPHSAKYACRSGFYAVGSVRKILCLPGGRWESLSYKCMTPIHGGYSSWGSWTSCTKSCDFGTQTRSRSCNNPSPQYGGNACQGNSTEIANCNEFDCPKVTPNTP
ncbi:thrombospondin-2-like [Saccostrea cucullata]|uniref:thrombospondin-2-like n=1 Tax=Saccostrea cuccullata TaxID=36930 RepID=UPI002ED61D27